MELVDIRNAAKAQVYCTIKKNTACRYIYIYTYIQAHVKSLLGNCSPFAGSCYNNRMHFPFVQFPAVITSDLSIGFEIPTIPSIPPPPLLYTGFRAPLYRHRRQKLLLYVYIYIYYIQSINILVDIIDPFYRSK